MYSRVKQDPETNQVKRLIIISPSKTGVVNGLLRSGREINLIQIGVDKDSSLELHTLATVFRKFDVTSCVCINY